MVSFYILYCYLCIINTLYIKQIGMDNIKKSSISKSRSYTACLSEAHRMLFDNFRVIFSRTWIYFAALAVISAVCFMLYTHTMLYGNSTGQTVAMCGFSLLMLCSVVVYYSRVMFLVNVRPMKWNIIRGFRLAACYYAFCILVWGAQAFITYNYVLIHQPISPEALMPLAIAFNVANIVIGLLMLPYVYAAVKYFIEPESKLRHILTSSYATGLRHWGFMFMAMLPAVLCVLLIALFLSIPMLIVITANSYSVFGVNFIGDPTGLPSYFPVIEGSVFALTFFIWAYLNVFVIFVGYFLYGSIEARKKEKKAFLKQEQLTA